MCGDLSHGARVYAIYVLFVGVVCRSCSKKSIRLTLCFDFSKKFPGIKIELSYTLVLKLHLDLPPVGCVWGDSVANQASPKSFAGPPNGATLGVASVLFSGRAIA